MAQRWEYKVIFIGNWIYDSEKDEEPDIVKIDKENPSKTRRPYNQNFRVPAIVLNEAGNDGWELVTTKDEQSGTWHYFKRPVTG